QLLGDLALPRVGQVVDVPECRVEVVLRVVVLSGDDLGRRQDLQQPPVEADVDVALGVAEGEVVQLLGGERVEPVVRSVGGSVGGHRGRSYGRRRRGRQAGGPFAHHHARGAEGREGG